MVLAIISIHSLTRNIQVFSQSRSLWSVQPFICSQIGSYLSDTHDNIKALMARQQRRRTDEQRDKHKSSISLAHRSRTVWIETMTIAKAFRTISLSCYKERSVTKAPDDTRLVIIHDKSFDKVRRIKPTSTFENFIVHSSSLFAQFLFTLTLSRKTCQLHHQWPTSTTADLSGASLVPNPAPSHSSK